jgi:hypothetical protein
VLLQFFVVIVVVAVAFVFVVVVVAVSVSGFFEYFDSDHMHLPILTVLLHQDGSGTD